MRLTAKRFFSSDGTVRNEKNRKAPFSLIPPVKISDGVLLRAGTFEKRAQQVRDNVAPKHGIEHEENPPHRFFRNTAHKIRNPHAGLRQNAFDLIRDRSRVSGFEKIRAELRSRKHKNEVNNAQAERRENSSLVEFHNLEKMRNEESEEG